ncbi:endoglucanase 5 [Macadamia integrifolia]|uniref:endoglucanase 5 n=1 Tax=Macadamia integrifolia TaxID=60698 RepID=UPI001C4E8DF7|nr:endoglucanase 5 [Macadamia integrifolia]
MKTLTNIIYVAVFVGLLGSPAIKIAAGFDYGDALIKSLKFFEAQKSGKLPANHQVNWRGDSGLRDGFQQEVDLVGGYYDAGDHVKFGFPMAFTVTLLAWGAIDFRHEIAAANQLGNTLDVIKWGTDYFIKAHTQPNVLWAQVGDGYSDHYCWERPEDMTTSRTAYKVDAQHPGSDIAGETAAALAAASLAFKLYNSTYSSLLLSHAKQLFSFADNFRGRYDDSISSARDFYPSASGYSDELLWAASWLFRATGDQYYLKYVSDNAGSLGGTGMAMTEFSWDNKYAGVQILLSKVLLEGAGNYYTSTLKQYKAKADYFACANLQKNNGYNVPLTPGGLVHLHQWNNMQYASSAAFLLAVYSDYLSVTNAVLSCPGGQVQPEALLKFSQSQADYILGKNPKYLSYLVGFGENYPVHVHHRGASIPSIYALQSTVGCVDGFEEWYNRPEGNPNVLVGALVGGPDMYDGYSDERSNYEQSEPTISGAAPLIGLFSKLQSLSGTSGSYSKPSPAPYHKALPVPHYHKASPVPHYGASKLPVEFLHSITATWRIGQMTYYRHKVIIKNTSMKSITYLKLAFKNLSGPIWGLSTTAEKNIYLLPHWIKVLNHGSQCIFVYIQGGPQAKISVISYH